MLTVDAIKKETSLDKIPLDWVGMGQISLPLRVSLQQSSFQITSKINVFVYSASLPVMVSAQVSEDVIQDLKTRAEEA